MLIVLQSCSSKSPNSHNNDTTLSSLSFQRTYVNLAKVKKGDFELEMVSNGKTSANNTLSIRIPFSAKIKVINVQNGDKVQAGQVLVIMDDTELAKILARSKESFEKALVELDDRLIDYGYRLKDSARVPKDIFKMAKIKSGFNRAKYELTDAQLELKKTIIRAPFTGRIANLEADPYKVYDSNSLLCNLINDNWMKIDFYVLETEYDFISKRSAISVIPFGGSHQLAGRIISVNPLIEENGMIKVVGKVTNEESQLLDGMSVRVIIKKTIPDRIIIPKGAVVQRQKRDVVFTYNKGKAIWNYVDIELRNSEYVSLRSGLTQGQSVIVTNNLNLANETEVSVEQDSVK